MKEEKAEKSFGELPTLGHEEQEKPEQNTAPEGPSWTELGLSQAATLKPKGGIVDDGRTDAARRWRAGEAILGRYVVEGELGQGGMGVVYGCLDKVGGVKVAVKCLPPELGHNSVEMEEVRENFQLVCGLAHPNIAVVRQLERDEKGEYYLVMELAEGESLRRWLRAKWKAGGVSLAEAVGVLRQVAAALDYAHGMKVVHRDVKPGNVMIDGKGRVKVLDFGLAAQIRTSLSRASHAYRGTSGTGPYMAPEQWRAQPQDAKTDQYALGVMAYEMLAGRLPFENPELAVLKDAVLNGEVAGIPGGPEMAMAAIRRAMAKRAEERFGSCGEFVEALEGKRVVGGMGAGRGEGDRPTVRPGQNTDAARAGRQGGDGDVFLRKVRVGKALEGAGREDTTAEEKVELEKVREVFAAGEEALKAGDHAAAWSLFGQAEEGLAVWRAHLAARREEAARAEAERRAEERRLEAARQEVRRRREEERKARERAEEAVRKRRREEERKALERAEEAVRKEAERKRVEAAARRRENRIRMGKVLGVLALVGVLVWGAGVVVRSLQGTWRAWRVAKELGLGTRAGETKSITLPGGATMEMVWCPPGSFTMGSTNGEDDEKPPHKVTLTKGFWMAKTEVTQEQWKSVTGSNPANFEGYNLPVECVSWKDCQAFCRKTGLSLPTEAQWEYACRAGTAGDYGGTGDFETMGWYLENSGRTTHPVGQKEANAWGLYDMHGNVGEWCADWYGAYPSGSVEDPTGPSRGSFRVIRGGSWCHHDARSCRSAGRGCGGPGGRFNNLGLRVALLPVQ